MPAHCVQRQFLRFAAVSLGLLLAGCSHRITYRVSGVVRDANTGAPLPSVKVNLVVRYRKGGFRPSAAPSAKPTLPVLTGQDGRFSFEVSVADQTLVAAPQDWAVLLEKPQYKPREMLIGVEAKDEAMDKIRIYVGADLTGTRESRNNTPP